MLIYKKEENSERVSGVLSKIMTGTHISKLRGSSKSKRHDSSESLTQLCLTDTESPPPTPGGAR